MCKVREEKGTAVIGLGLIFLDQLSKFWFLSLGKTTVNLGVAFGIRLNYYLAIWLSFFLLVILLTRLFFKKNSWWLWLVFAGGLSNLLDRIIWGGVVDFIRLGFLPLFNLADLAICVGVTIFVWQTIDAGLLSKLS